MDPTPQSPGEWIATAIGTGGFVALAWQRIRRMWSTDGAAATMQDAQTDVVQTMRGELTRLAEQNGKLANLVNTLQLRVLELNQQNADLQLMVGQLRDEVAQLKAKESA